MSFTTHLGCWLLVLILSFGGSVSSSPALVSLPLSLRQAADEAALRALAETFLRRWAAKDIDGTLALWSAKAPELEAWKKAARELFASSERIEMSNLVIRKITLSDDQARVRVAVEVKVIAAKTGQVQEGYGHMLRALVCVRETGGWRIAEEHSAHDELANALLATSTEEARAALLAADAELVTPELPRALGRSSERLRDEKQYEQALAAAKLSLKMSEQLNDRPGQGLAWELIGRVYGAQRDYPRAVEYHSKSLAVFEALGDKSAAARLQGRIAGGYSLMDNQRPALEHNLRRLALLEQLGDKWRLASALDDITANYYRLGNFQSALATARRGLKLYEETDDSGGIARVLTLLGNIHLEQSDYEQAIETYQKAGTIWAALDDKTGLGLTTLNIGEVYSKLGDYNRALDAYQKALAAFTAKKDLARTALALYNIGTAYSSQADQEQARDYYQRSLALYEQAHRPLGSAEALSAIGNSYQRQGDYGRALDYLHRGLKLLEEAGRKLGMADALVSIGNVHFNQGDEKLALEFYQKSLALFDELGSKEKIAFVVGRVGAVEQRRGDNNRALAAYEQSLALYKAIGNKNGMADALSTVGDSYLSLKLPDRARASYQESLALFEETGNKNGIAEAMLGMARVQQAQDDHNRALSTAETVAGMAEKTGNLELLWEINTLIGKSHLALKQNGPAQQAFERAVSAIEVMRRQAAGSEMTRRLFLEHRLSPYQAMIDLLVSQRKPGEALKWAERSKARVLLDVLQSGRSDMRQAMSADERRQDQTLRSELISLNTQLVQLDRIGQTGQPSLARASDLKARLDRTRSSYEAFQSSLYAAHPELQVRRGEAPLIQSDELMELLPDDKTALLEYAVTGEATYLFVATKANGKPEAQMQVFTLPVKRAELTRQTEEFRQQLAGRDLGFSDAARGLYDLLLKPAQAQLRGKTALVIVPDETLWEMPFQALMADDNRYVLKNSAVSYAPSLTVLRETAKVRRERSKQMSGATLLALGNPALGKETAARAALVLRDEKLDPLPEAEVEVKGLGQLYGASRSKIYIGAEAREDRVKTEAGNFQVLHFATHGILNNAAPMYSHLVLTQSNANKEDLKEDGLLEAWELMQMDLKADLAVLSACETARGRFGAGEGVIGLTWALFVAGVPATVVSQWKVESAGTRELMVNFHQAMKAPPGAGKTSLTKAEALRQAALRLMKNSETNHPFYWASFVLIGDGR